MSSWQRPPDLATCAWVLATALAARQQHHFGALLTGALFAAGRGAVSAWVRRGGQSPHYRACYRLVAQLGRRADELAQRLLVGVLPPRLAGGGDRL